MPIKDPNNYSFLQQIFLFGIVAAIGGFVNYLSTIRKGQAFSWHDSIIEFVSSGFVGVLFGMFFLATNMNIYLAFVGAGAAGHFGTRSLMVLRDAYKLKDTKNSDNN